MPRYGRHGLMRHPCRVISRQIQIVGQLTDERVLLFTDPAAAAAPVRHNLSIAASSPASAHRLASHTRVLLRGPRDRVFKAIARCVAFCVAYLLASNFDNAGRTDDRSCRDMRVNSLLVTTHFRRLIRWSSRTLPAIDEFSTR